VLVDIDISQLIYDIDGELQAEADPAYREQIRTQYNMDVENFWGVRTPAIRTIGARHYKRLQALEIDRRLEVCRALLETRLYEHRIMAFHWAYLARRDHAARHLEVFASWLDEYVDDWIDCDDLCNRVVGDFLLRFSECAGAVLAWTGSPNLWMRRGAAVSLVLPARQGQQLEVVLAVADALLEDREDLVQKGYGWMLKEASRAHPQEVFDYVVSRRGTMPRVALRAAIKKLPDHLRREAMGKGN
jgi:3-methyladenine DNA glycosylase AlkD